VTKKRAELRSFKRNKCFCY